MTQQNLYLDGKKHAIPHRDRSSLKKPWPTGAETLSYFIAGPLAVKHNNITHILFFNFNIK